MRFLSVASLFLFFNLLWAENSIEVFQKYRNVHFVETGTYKGDGVQNALKLGYAQVHSVELAPDLYKFCKDRFSGQSNVHIWFGDSTKILWDMIEDIDAPITFWLDGHYSGGETISGLKHSPIMEELDQIKKHPIKNHTILIDDVRDFGSSYFDYTTEEEIILKILEINPEYKIVFEDCGTAKGDILVAFIPK